MTIRCRYNHIPIAQRADAKISQKGRRRTLDLAVESGEVSITLPPARSIRWLERDGLASTGARSTTIQTKQTDSIGAKARRKAESRRTEGATLYRSGSSACSQRSLWQAVQVQPETAGPSRRAARDS